MNPIFQQILDNLIPAAIGAAAAWFTTRKQKKAELAQKGVEIEKMKAEMATLRADGSKKIMDNYQEALDDLKHRYEERFNYLKEEYEMRHSDLKLDYERKHERLKEERDEQIEKLNRKIENLSRDVRTWKEKYRVLKKEFDDYKNRTATGNMTPEDGK